MDSLNIKIKALFLAATLSISSPVLASDSDPAMCANMADLVGIFHTAAMNMEIKDDYMAIVNNAIVSTGKKAILYPEWTNMVVIMAEGIWDRKYQADKERFKTVFYDTCMEA